MKHFNYAISYKIQGSDQSVLSFFPVIDTVLFYESSWTETRSRMTRRIAITHERDLEILRETKWKWGNRLFSPAVEAERETASAEPPLIPIEDAIKSYTINPDLDSRCSNGQKVDSCLELSSRASRISLPSWRERESTDCRSIKTKLPKEGREDYESWTNGTCSFESKTVSELLSKLFFVSGHWKESFNCLRVIALPLAFKTRRKE